VHDRDRPLGVETIAFPYHSLAVPTRRCLSVPLGFIDEAVIRELEEKDYDYAPVLSEDRKLAYGMVSRVRLRELHELGLPLRQDDSGIRSHDAFHIPLIGPSLDQEYWSAPSLVSVLRMLLESPAVLLTIDQMNERWKGLYGIVTEADLNRPELRHMLYARISRLEQDLATLVKKHYQDPWDWISKLNEDHQACIVGSWTLARKRGYETDPTHYASLTHLIKVVCQDRVVLEAMGRLSASASARIMNVLPGLRNKVMHPVRPLVLNKNDIQWLIGRIQALERLCPAVDTCLKRPTEGEPADLWDNPDYDVLSIPRWADSDPT